MIFYESELYHYGVKGMKWGVRKTRKWATSKHQPSSTKSSALAGIYAATGNKRVGKALDKSNSRDAANWERAKKDYKNHNQARRNRYIEKTNRKYKQGKANASAVRKELRELKKKTDLTMSR